MIDITQVKLFRLYSTYNFLPFDCSDSDLNEFLLTESKNYLEKLLAVTYVLEYQGCILAFYSVSNDKISAKDFPSNNMFKKLFKDKMPVGKKLKSYPAVKIGRFGVNKNYQRDKFGTWLLDYIKGWFLDNNRTGCQYITVDAYNRSLKFYERNGFKYFSDEDKGRDTRQMYFPLINLLELINQ